MSALDINMNDQEPFITAARILLGEANAYFMIKKDTYQKAKAIKTVARYNNYSLEQQEDMINNEDKYIKANKYMDIYDNANQLIDVCEGITSHPCGCMLFDGDIEKTFGLVRFKDGSIGVPVSGSSLDMFKYLKLDFLVATTWTIIAGACEDAGITIPSTKELQKIVYKPDSKAFKIAQDGITATICQLNTYNGKSKAMEFKPESIAEISDLSAAIRPGFQSMIDTFLKRINFKYGVKVLDDYLISSTGCKQSFMLYQEQAMEIMQMAGISLAESYIVLKAISKKKKNVIDSYKDTFVDGFTKYLLELDKVDKDE